MVVSGSGPEGQNPLEGIPLFGDLARLFSSQGPVNWDVARQMASWIASEGASESNVDPLERMRLEELARVADMHVAELTGLPTAGSGGTLRVTAVTASQWASRTLEAYRPLLESLSTALARGRPDEGDEGAEDPAGRLLGDLSQVLGPVLLGVQSGYMVGHLSRRALGQYDLPLPRVAGDELLMVPANIDAFGSEWSLPPADLRMWLCIRDVTLHAVLSRPHVRETLLSLLGSYVTGFQVDTDAFESSLAEVDPTDMEALQALLGNPETLLGAMQTPAQRELLVRIQTLLAAVVGYADHVLDELGTRLVGSYGMISEALRRRRVEAGDADRFVQRLLGVELGVRQYEQGAAFVRGVVERAGDAGLGRLWKSERELPTQAELEAPGLWLARIDLPDG